MPPTTGTPQLALTFDPPGPTFYISGDARMPTIRATASITGIAPAGLANVQYRWTVGLLMQAAKVPLAMGHSLAMPVVRRVTTTNSLTLPFAKVRGGDLTVKVEVTIAGKTLKAESQKLMVLGTNPTDTALGGVGASELMVKIIRFESGTRQFETQAHLRGYPLFSRDRQHGVGLTQLTSPQPTADEIWDWKENLRGGMRVLRQKHEFAHSYLTNYPSSIRFQKLVEAYKDAVKKQLVPGVKNLPENFRITIDAATDEQLERETLRAYNGYGRTIPDPDFPKTAHHAAHTEFLWEYEALTDPVTGVLVVDIDASGFSGKARWHENTADDRIAWWKKHQLVKRNSKGKYLYPGDPDYVSHVLKTPIIDPPVVIHAKPNAGPNATNPAPR